MWENLLIFFTLTALEYQEDRLLFYAPKSLQLQTIRQLVLEQFFLPATVVRVLQTSQLHYGASVQARLLVDVSTVIHQKQAYN